MPKLLSKHPMLMEKVYISSLARVMVLSMAVLDNSLFAQNISALPSRLGEQTAPIDKPAPASSSKFEDMEATFKKKMTEIREPYLKQYLAELEKMKNIASINLDRQDFFALGEEIKRISDELANGYSLPPLPSDKPAGTPRPGTSPAKVVPELVLEPGRFFKGLTKYLEKNAQVILRSGETKAALPSETPLHQDIALAGFKKAEWEVDTIPAGAYEFYLLYNCDSDPTGSTFTMKIGTNTFNIPFVKAHQTKSKNFRVQKLGQVDLPEDIPPGALELTFASGTSSATLQLKQAYLLPKEKSPPATIPDN